MCTYQGCINNALVFRLDDMRIAILISWLNNQKESMHVLMEDQRDDLFNVTLTVEK